MSREKRVGLGQRQQSGHRREVHPESTQIQAELADLADLAKGVFVRREGPDTEQAANCQICGGHWTAQMPLRTYRYWTCERPIPNASLPCARCRSRRVHTCTLCGTSYSAPNEIADRPCDACVQKNLSSCAPLARRHARKACLLVAVMLLGLWTCTEVIRAGWQGLHASLVMGIAGTLAFCASGLLVTRLSTPRSRMHVAGRDDDPPRWIQTAFWLVWLLLIVAALSYQRDAPHLFTISGPNGVPITVECWLDEWGTGVEIYVRTADGRLGWVENHDFDSVDAANDSVDAANDAEAFRRLLGLPPPVPHPLHDAAVAACEQLAPSRPARDNLEWLRALE